MKYILLAILLFIYTSTSAQKDSIRKSNISEVLIEGKMREMYKIDSPLPIETYTSAFFKKAVVNNLLDATQQITGLRPQINCSVCNTGDIHLNGMEGAYTTILIDGMPVVSSLASIYGLSGIPMSMIDRIEVVKGPASAIYGSEAMAGVINVVTKNPSQMDLLSVEGSLSTLKEANTDIAFTYPVLKKWKAFTSINAFNYQNKIDVNDDHFTDVALQKRISVFTKLSAGTISHPFIIGLRLFTENRWGGELNWEPKFRGTDSVYGESIQTNRLEVLASWDLPIKIPIVFQHSYVYHQQESFYGKVPFNAKQHTVFSQLIYKTKLLQRDLSFGLSQRIQYYDDNTLLTRSIVDTSVSKGMLDYLPGTFLQLESKKNNKWMNIYAMRIDLHKEHGLIFSPRISYQYKANEILKLKAGIGKGFRVVNVFTEDHAALTGDRKVRIAEKLNPESSINTYFAIDHFLLLSKTTFKSEIHFFYSYFFNRIQANYDINPNEIIYQNLRGHCITRGINAKFDLQTERNWNMQLGLALLDAFEKNSDSVDSKIPLMFSSALNINFNFTYSIPKYHLKFDYQVNGYSPMRLPVLPNDYRDEYSNWYFIHQIQGNYEINKQWEVFASIKNIFNFLPADPIMRPFDPFDKQVHINNPNAYTFDTTYGYAPMQGRRLLVGLRYKIVSHNRVRER